MVIIPDPQIQYVQDVLDDLLRYESQLNVEMRTKIVAASVMLRVEKVTSVDIR